MLNHKYTSATSRKLIKQMGAWAFIRYCKNVGMTFEETYFECFGCMPKI